MLFYIYEYDCLCLSQTQVGGLFQATELAFIIGGSRECKQSKDGACSPAFLHALVCPLNRSYLCVCLHLFMQDPACEASIKLCLQWLGPDSLSDAWPGSDPLIRLVRGFFLRRLPFEPQVWRLGRCPSLLWVTFWRFLPPELIVIPSPAASAPFGTKPDLMFSVVMLLGNQPLPSLPKRETPHLHCHLSWGCPEDLTSFRAVGLQRLWSSCCLPLQVLGVVDAWQW